MNFRNINPIFPFFVILYIKRMVMDIPTNNQEEKNGLICEKNKVNITVPGGAIY